MQFDINKAVQELAASVEEKKKDDRTNSLVQLLSTQYEKSALYSNLIIGAGYVGFFSAWSNVQYDLTNFERTSSMLCITISLIFFVFWEIGKMIATSIFNRYQSKILESSSQEFDSKLKKMALNEKLFNIISMKLWPVNLLLTIIPALFGAGVLVCGLIRNLFI